MALILLVNLAFSIVGFFTIFRMWREVKSRRDYYGEHFEIPRGIDRTEKRKKHVKRHEEIEEPKSNQMSMNDIEEMVIARLQEEKRKEEERQREIEERERQERQREIEEKERQEQQRQFQEQGDLQRMIAAAIAEQMEGRSA